MKTKQINAKLIAILMAVVLCLVGLAALATRGLAEGNVAKINDTEYATLQDAVDAAGDGQTVVLMKDLTGNSVQQEALVSKKSITLDLNGHKITGTYSLGAIRVDGNDQSATLKITDNQKTGAISTSSDAIYQYLNSNVCLENVKIESSGSRGVYLASSGNHLTVGPGTSVNGSTSAIKAVTGNTITVSGGTIQGSTCCVDGGTLTVSGGNFITTGEGASNWSTNTNVVNSVSGGYFTNEVKPEELATGMKCVDDTITVEGCKYRVESEYVAKIGTTPYNSLFDAASAAVAGNTIEILVAGEYSYNDLNPINDKAVTVKSTLNSNEAVILQRVTTGTDLARANGNGNCATFENLTIKFAEEEGKNGITHSPNGGALVGNVTFNNCVISGFLYGYDTMTFTDCKFVLGAKESKLNMTTYGANVTYTRCTFDGSVNVYWDSITADRKIVFDACRFNKADKVNTANAAVFIKAAGFETKCKKLEVEFEGTQTLTGYDNVTYMNNDEIKWNGLRHISDDGLWQVDTLTSAYATVKVGESTVFPFGGLTAGSFILRDSDVAEMNVEGLFAEGFRAKKGDVAGYHNNGTPYYLYTVEEISYVAQVGDTKYETLTAAVAAAQSGDTITMLKDVTLENTRLDFKEKDFTLDLNGKTLKLANEASLFFINSSFVVKNGTITGSGIGKQSLNAWTEKIEVGDASVEFNSVSFNFHDVTCDIIKNDSGTLRIVNSELTFDSNVEKAIYLNQASDSNEIIDSTITAKNSKSVTPADSAFIKNDDAASTKANLTIKGSTITLEPNTAKRFMLNCITTVIDSTLNVASNDIAFNNTNLELKKETKGSTLNLTHAGSHGFTNGQLIVNDGCTVNVSDVQFLGLNVKGDSVFKSGSTVNVSDCGKGSTANYANIGISVVDAGNSLTIENGANVTVDGIVSSGWLTDGTPSNINIADGKYTQVFQKDATASTSKISLTGGIYTQKPDDAYIARGYKCVDNTDSETSGTYPYTIGKDPDSEMWVARVGSEWYATIEEALTVAKTAEAKTTVYFKAYPEYIFTKGLDGELYSGSNRMVYLSMANVGSATVNTNFYVYTGKGAETAAKTMQNIMLGSEKRLDVPGNTLKDGDIVLLPEGDIYDGSSIVDMYGDITIVGAGEERTVLHPTTIYSGSTGYRYMRLYNRYAENVTKDTNVYQYNFKNLTFNGDVQKGGNLNTFVVTCYNIEINAKNVTFKNFPGSVFSIWANDTLSDGTYPTKENNVGVKVYLDNVDTQNTGRLVHYDCSPYTSRDLAAGLNRYAFIEVNYLNDCTFNGKATPTYDFNESTAYGQENCWLNSYSTSFSDSDVITKTDVRPAAAKIGAIGYATVQDAFTAAKIGDTVRIVADFEGTVTVEEKAVKVEVATGKTFVPVYSGNGIVSGDAKFNADNKLVAGTFSADPSAYIAPGYVVKEVDDKYVVEPKIVIPTEGGGSIGVDVETESKEPEAKTAKTIPEENKQAAGEVAAAIGGQGSNDIVNLNSVVAKMVDDLSMDKVEELAEKNDKAEALKQALDVAKTQQTAGNDVNIKTDITTKTLVEVTDVKTEEKTEGQQTKTMITTFALDITPVYTMTVTTTVTKPDGELVKKTEVKVVEDEKLEVNEPKTVTFKAPENFKYEQGMQLFVKHTKADGTIYTYNATYDANAKTISFNNPNGFSDFELIVTNAQTEDVAAVVHADGSADYYTTLQDAFDDAAAGETVLLLQDYTNEGTAEDLYISSDITFNLGNKILDGNKKEGILGIDANVKIENGTITNESTKPSSKAVVIYNGTLTVGKNVKLNINANTNKYAIYDDSKYNSISLAAGEYDGIIEAQTVSISGGKYYGEVRASNILKITGGEFKAKVNLQNIMGDCSISGGIFDGDVICANQSVSGGHFKTKLDQSKLADDKCWSALNAKEAGYYSVVDAVAEYKGVRYASVAEAIAVAGENEIKLLKDAEYQLQPNGKKITVNSNIFTFNPSAPAGFTVVQDEDNPKVYALTLDAPTVDVPSISKTYDGKADKSTASSDAAGATFKWYKGTDQVCEVATLSVTNAEKADYTVKAYAPNGYESTATTVAVEITKKAATITAVDKSILQGDNIPDLTATVDGNVDDDVLGYTVNCECSDTTVCKDYQITVTLTDVDVNNNYEITCKPGTLTIRPAAAKIGSVYYETFVAAFTVAQDATTAQTIELLKNVEVNSTLKVTKALTIDGGNFTIKASDSFDANANNLIEGTANLTLENVTLDANQKARVIKMSSGKLDITGVKVKNGKAKDYAGGIFMTGASELVMNSGSISGNANTTIDPEYLSYASDLWIGSQAKGEIKDGTVGNAFVNANEYADQEDCGLTQSGGEITNVFVEWEGNKKATFTKSGGTVTKVIVANDNNDPHNTAFTEIDNAENGTYTAKAVAQIGSAQYSSLAEAVAAANNNETVTLLENVTLAQRVDINKSGATLTIDLGGKTITTTKTCTNGSAFNVVSGTVNIKNGKLVGIAGPTGQAEPYNLECDVITVRSGAVANLESLNISVNSQNGACAYAFDGGHINIASGTYKNETNIATSGNQDFKAMTVNQANVSTQLIEISGGTFYGMDPAAGDDSGKCTNFLQTGYVSTPVSGGYQVVPNGNIVAMIGNVGYTSLQAAVDAAEAGETVKLVKNIELEAQVDVKNNVIIDMAGKRISNTTDIWNEDTNSYAMIAVKDGATVTLTGNGTIDAKENDVYGLNVVKGTLNIENGTIIGNISAVQVQEGTLNIKGGDFAIKQKASGDDGNRYLLNCIDENYKAKTAQINVTGGTFEGFDPRDNKSEGEHTSYVGEDYYSKAKDDRWTVYPAVAKLNGWGYSTLREALVAARSAEAGKKTITVIGNAAGCNFNGDNTGITIQGSATGKITGDFGADGTAVMKDVTISGLKFEGAKITFSTNVTDYTNFMIEGCTFNGPAGTTNPSAITINRNGTVPADGIRIIGNTIKNFTQASSTAILIGSSETLAHDVVISNNTIDNVTQNGIQALGIDRLTISGNTITNDARGAVNLSDSKNVTLTGNTLSIGSAEGKGFALTNVNTGVVIVGTGNTFKSANGTQDINLTESIVEVAKDGVVVMNTTQTGNFTEGTFIAGSKAAVDAVINQSKTAQLVSGKKNTYTLVDAVAKIGDVRFATLKDAVENAQPNQTVTLLKDVIINEQLNIDKAITLDGGNYKVTRSPGGTVASDKAGILVTAAAEIKNLTVFGPNTTASGWDNGEFGIKCYKAEATLNNVTVKDANAGIQVNDGSVKMIGTIDVTGNEFGGIELCKGGKLDLKAAKLVCTDEADAKPVLWNDDNKGTITFGNQILGKKVVGGTKDHYYLYVAQIGEKKYQSLAKAIDAVQSGETITMLYDVDGAHGISVPSDKNFIVDFANHTYTINHPGAGSTGTSTQGFQLLKGSTIEFKNGTINVAEENRTYTWTGDPRGIAWVINNYADLTLTNMNVDGRNVAKNLATEGGLSDPGIIRYVINNYTGTLTTNGGSIIAATGDVAVSANWYGAEYDKTSYPNKPVATLNGTTVTGKVEAIAGTINLENGTTVNGMVRVGKNAEGSATGATVNINAGAEVTDSNYVAVFGANTLNVRGKVNGCVCTNGNAYNAGSIINIYDGAVVTNSNNNFENGDAVYMPNGTLNISGGTITGATAVYFKSTNLNITGGTFNGTGTKVEYNYNGNGGNATGDALVIDSCNYPSGIVAVSVKGGKFNSTYGNAVAAYTSQGATAVTKFVSGGYFTQEVNADYIAPGYECISTPDGDPNKGAYPFMVRSKVIIPFDDQDPSKGGIEVQIDTESEQKAASVDETKVTGDTEKEVAADIIGKINGSGSGENKSEVVDLTETVGNYLSNINLTKVKEIAKETDTKHHTQNESALNTLLDNAKEAAITKNVEVTMNVTTDVDVKVVGVTVEENNKEKVTRFALDITPYYTLTVTSKVNGVEQTPVQIVTEDMNEKLDVPETTTVTFPAPDGFVYTSGMSLFVIHTKESGEKFTYPANYNSYTKMISFTNPNGFSEFEVVTTSVTNPVAQNLQTGTCYDDLAAALSQAETSGVNQTVILLKNLANQGVVEVAPNVTLDLNGYDLEARLVVAFGLVKNNQGSADGILKVAKGSFMYSIAEDSVWGKCITTSNDNVLPVWNGSGYVFYDVNRIRQIWTYPLGDTEHNPRYLCQPRSNDIQNVLKNNNGISVYVEINYIQKDTDDNGQEKVRNKNLIVTFDREFIDEFLVNPTGLGMFVSLAGTENVSSISARTILKSDNCGLSIVSDSITTNR